MPRLDRGNLLATIKELKKRKRPKTTIAPPSVQAIVPSSATKITPTLSDVIAERRNILLGYRNVYGNSLFMDKSLFARLTTFHRIRLPFNGSPNGEMFIHWFYRPRRIDKLSSCEVFHLNMLQYFNVMDRVSVIHIRCAAKCGSTAAMQRAISILSSGKASVDFKIVPQKASWEHDTFKECVEYSISSGKFVYYTHFKGVSRLGDSNVGIVGKSVRGSTPLDLLYWCYLMYLALFTAPSGVKAIGPLLHLGKNKSYYNRDISWSQLCKDDQVFHYCGSFQAFSGSYIYECLSACGLSDINVRLKKLWVNDPYTVEMFLSMVSLRKDVYSLDVSYKQTNGMYGAFSRHSIPKYEASFKKLFASICIANWSYKNIGGTETFNYAMATALKQMGYSVCYYAPKMGINGITEKELVAAGISPYKGEPLICCFANQNVGAHFVGKCPVIQTCHSAIVGPEQPIRNMNAYVSITEEVSVHLTKLGYKPIQIRNGIDLERFSSRKSLRDVPRVLSICQGDDSLLREACSRLGWSFVNVPKSSDARIWHIEDLINDADIVVGIGRSLYDAMACGRVCISWDNRQLNPFTGCGYVTASNWHTFATTNFIGRGFPAINSVDMLVAELQKYNPADGASMRTIAEAELDVRKNVMKYLALAGVV